MLQDLSTHVFPQHIQRVGGQKKASFKLNMKEGTIVQLRVLQLKLRQHISTPGQQIPQQKKKRECGIVGMWDRTYDLKHTKQMKLIC